MWVSSFPFLLFQSTLPVGGATTFAYVSRYMLKISIHAPRGGSDLWQAAHYRRQINFNPRSPWGERPPAPAPDPITDPISIHAPRGGSDT